MNGWFNYGDADPFEGGRYVRLGSYGEYDIVTVNLDPDSGLYILSTATVDLDDSDQIDFDAVNDFCGGGTDDDMEKVCNVVDYYGCTAFGGTEIELDKLSVIQFFDNQDMGEFFPEAIRSEARRDHDEAERNAAINAGDWYKKADWEALEDSILTKYTEENKVSGCDTCMRIIDSCIEYVKIRSLCNEYRNAENAINDIMELVGADLDFDKNDVIEILIIGKSSAAKKGKE